MIKPAKFLWILLSVALLQSCSQKEVITDTISLTTNKNVILTDYSLRKQPLLGNPEISGFPSFSKSISRSFSNICINESQIFYTSKKRLISYNLLSSQKSSYKVTPLSSHSSLACQEDAVFIASDGVLQSYDMKAKQSLWKTKFDNFLHANISVDSQNIYLLTVDGHLKSFSQNDGEIKWNTKMFEESTIRRAHFAPINLRESLYVVDHSLGSNIINKSSGQILANSLIDVSESYAFDIMGLKVSPVYNYFDNTILVATKDGIFGTDSSSGVPIWNLDIKNTTALSVVNDRYFAFATSAEIAMMNLSNMQARFVVNLASFEKSLNQYNNRQVVSLFLVEQGKTYLAALSNIGELILMDVNSGSVENIFLLLDQINRVEKITQNPVIVNNSLIIPTNFRTVIVTFDAEL